MKKYQIFVLILSGFFYASCNKYLDIQPKGVQLLITVGDYDKWLNGQALMYSVPYELNYLSDNMDKLSLTVPPVVALDRAYTWQAQFDPSGLQNQPLFWQQHYGNIYYFNTVINNIDGATGGTAQQKSSLKAEALLGRAFEYLYLVNEYGKPYNAGTASTDPAVPFVTIADVSAAIPQRSSVAQIYDNIISDLNTAIASLPADNQGNRYRGSISAAYSVLARTYLYRADYPNASKFAALALQNTSASMINYNSVPSPGVYSLDPDAIYLRQATENFFEFPADTSLLKYYNKNDLRLRDFFQDLTGSGFSASSLITRGDTYYYFSGSLGLPNNFGTSVAEMKLIIAEAAARDNDLTTALQQLNGVRSNRISKTAYQPYIYTNQDSVLNKVLIERQLEMPFNGLRWFDMRRLDAEDRMPVVKRYDGSGNTAATLPQHSARYTLQIPVQVMTYHPDWPQNP